MNRFNTLSSELQSATPTPHTYSSSYKWDSPYKSAGPSVSHPDDVVVCVSIRTAMTKAKRGGFKDTKTEEMLGPLFQEIFRRTHLKPTDVEDICIGNVLQASSALCARMGQFLGGIPECVPLYTTNRQCSSGLQAIMNIISSIKSGLIDIGIAGGVESMSVYTMENALSPESIATCVFDNEMARNCLIPMGMVSELFSEKKKFTRTQLDQCGVDSHQKAYRAHKLGLFREEIIPIHTEMIDKDGKSHKCVVDYDDGIRSDTTLESLSRLKSSFKKNGTSHAGNSSQMSDGAAVCLLAKRSKAEQLNLPIIAKFHGYHVSSMAPEMMPTGPALAIPEVLRKTGLCMGDIDIFEVNEAFASVAIHTINELNIPTHKFNPKGGAIAFGHPLGATGARQLATLLPELRRTHSRYGIVSMCIGTGMGAAAVFENCI
uniref:acetyl-CoA C-acyltransferase n=1 Tax=Nephromyces sp. MMRI TaxID=2496275 RepID=A0A3Q8UBQ9_9APIC|nr:acetyl-CoA acyltransferase 1 [Nephromyces sp. MMRI]AZL94418.1 acetyl-CoA acyltransferase 1 [Nephromyces sp. MMRI]AZL94420.1 acetyl-CoA acyltransferase 1 [Nephromyces sp. MMRI]AZL94421.1 acetyl-CoA acyltransferase 1 [Nephromyces sp. MMRI]AZL94422.1 acetyl-CoA acyltransferase 1 [Nephromyces sp. MMRI]